MIPLARVVPRALQDILRKAPTTPEKVAFAWRLAVGPSVDRATRVELRDGVLRVRVKDAAWRREVERSGALIRDRLNAVLGDGAVRALDVTLR